MMLRRQQATREGYIMSLDSTHSYSTFDHAFSYGPEMTPEEGVSEGQTPCRRVRDVVSPSGCGVKKTKRSLSLSLSNAERSENVTRGTRFGLSKLT